MTPSRYTYFALEELTCRCGCGQMKMDHDTMLKLVALRDLAGFSLPITSAYRCPAHNLAVGDTGVSGPHTTGRAVDVAVSRERATALVRAALGMGFRGIGLKQHGPDAGRFVHLDTMPRPAQLIWTY
jgi:uncharacterized protein YcbK (DUF882 family)